MLRSAVALAFVGVFVVLLAIGSQVLQGGVKTIEVSTSTSLGKLGVTVQFK